MNQKSNTTKYYAAMVIQKAQVLSEFRDKFQKDQDFAEVEQSVGEKGTYQFIIGGQDDRFGVIVSLPDKTFAACGAMNSWVCDSYDEAKELAERLSRPDETSEGHEVLVMSFDPAA